MGIADFILAGEGDLYDMNEYHMLAHIIIRNKVDDNGTICSRLYSIYWFCVLHISKLTNLYSYSMNAPLSLFCFCHVCCHSALYAEKWSNRPHLASSCGSYHVGAPVQRIGL